MCGFYLWKFCPKTYFSLWYMRIYLCTLELLSDRPVSILKIIYTCRSREYISLTHTVGGCYLICCTNIGWHYRSRLRVGFWMLALFWAEAFVVAKYWPWNKWAHRSNNCVIRRNKTGTFFHLKKKFVVSLKDYSLFTYYCLINAMKYRSQWPRGLRHGFTASRFLRFWVRIPPGALIFFCCCECCVLSDRGLCDELITRLEESYRLWCVVLCDLETSWMRRPWPALGPQRHRN